MSKIIPFIPAHVDLMDVRQSELDGIGSNCLDRYKLLAENAVGFTLIHDGRIIMAFGYYELWPGVMEIWVIPSAYTHQYPNTVARTMLRYMASFIASHKPHRLQTAALDDDFHSRFMEFMGFVKEGTMEQYSVDKKRYNMWAKIL